MREPRVAPAMSPLEMREVTVLLRGRAAETMEVAEGAVAAAEEGTKGTLLSTVEVARARVVGDAGTEVEGDGLITAVEACRAKEIDDRLLVAIGLEGLVLERLR